MIEEEDLFRSKDFTLHQLIGGNITSLPVIFSSDKSKAFLVAEKDVIIVSVSSGRWECILTHSTTENRNQNVISMHFESPNKLITYTSSGLRSVWDVETGAILSTGMLAVDNLEVYTCRHCADNSDIVICKSSEKLKMFTYKKDIMEPVCTTKAHKIHNLRQIAVTDEYLVVCDKRCIFIYFFDDGPVKNYAYSGKMQSIKGEQMHFVVAAACNDTVAASMKIGRVFLWDNVSKQDIKIPTRTVHWHQAAPSLVVTPVGFLVSGGSEATLVKYSLTKAKETMTPSFLPHFQASIVMLGLSDDGSLLSVVLEDNSVHFVLLSTMTVLSSPQVVLTRHKSLPPSLLPLISDPVYPDAIVVSALPGRLHWVDTKNGFAFDTIDVTGENALNRDGKGNLLDFSDIVSVAFSRELAVTSVSRVNSDIPGNLIRFWSRMSETGKLHLEFEYDCGVNMVPFVRVTANSETVLTVDNKGQLSSWERLEDNRNKWVQRKPVTFQTTRVSYVSQFKGPLVAAIHCLEPELAEEANADENEGILVVWDVSRDDAPVVQQSYCAENKFTAAEWDPLNSSPVLFLSTATYVCGYSVHSSTVIWLINNLPSFPRIGPTSSHFYFSLDRGVYVFKEANRELSGVVTFEQPNFYVTSSVAVNEGSKFKIVFATDKGFFVLSKKMWTIAARERNEESKKTAFARLVSSGQKEIPKRHLPADPKSALEMLAGPTHALAPVPLLAPRFIQSCLLPPKEV